MSHEGKTWFWDDLWAIVGPKVLNIKISRVESEVCIKVLNLVLETFQVLWGSHEGQPWKPMCWRVGSRIHLGPRTHRGPRTHPGRSDCCDCWLSNKPTLASWVEWNTRFAAIVQWRCSEGAVDNIPWVILVFGLVRVTQYFAIGSKLISCASSRPSSHPAAQPAIYDDSPKTSLPASNLTTQQSKFQTGVCYLFVVVCFCKLQKLLNF